MCYKLNHRSEKVLVTVVAVKKIDFRGTCEPCQMQFAWKWYTGNHYLLWPEAPATHAFKLLHLDGASYIANILAHSAEHLSRRLHWKASVIGIA